METENNKIIIFIDGFMFDVTKYASENPGGGRVLKKYHLKDATEAFNEATRGHSDGYVEELLVKMCIGKVEN